MQNKSVKMQDHFAFMQDNYVDDFMKFISSIFLNI